MRELDLLKKELYKIENVDYVGYLYNLDGKVNVEIAIKNKSFKTNVTIKQTIDKYNITKKINKWNIFIVF